jgi:hypothetical protein
MTEISKIKPTHTQRGAFVYVRRTAVQAGPHLATDRSVRELKRRDAMRMLRRKDMRNLLGFAEGRRGGGFDR